MQLAKVCYRLDLRLTISTYLSSGAYGVGIDPGSAGSWSLATAGRPDLQTQNGALGPRGSKLCAETVTAGFTCGGVGSALGETMEAV